jgi:hypothetical protein
VLPSWNRTDWVLRSGGSTNVRREVSLDARLPLWLPVLVTTLPALLFWLWWDRSPRLGNCQEWGYDLTGNVSGRCPECGEKIVSKDQGRNVAKKAAGTNQATRICESCKSGLFRRLQWSR